NGYSVLAAVNGPVEVQRKDEIPEESAIDVVLRPAAGVGGIPRHVGQNQLWMLTDLPGVRERHLESIVKKALREVILVSAHPRTLIQITLQVVSTPAEGSGSGGLHQSASNISLLPALLQSSMLALLSTSLPLCKTLTSTIVAVSPSGELSGEPSAHAVKEALSLHILGFSSHGELLVAESEGAYDVDIWEQVFDRAQSICRGSEAGAPDGTGDVNMDSSEQDSLESSLRHGIAEKTATEQRWKESLR
ncbi:MAG: hypothetical protein LQ338_002559, partial [Usnochroma carphineum]